MVQEFIGFKLGLWRKLAYGVLVLLTGGTFWLFVRAFPLISARLLTQCHADQADYVLVKVGV